MTQTKLLFGSLLLRKHVNSSTVHCSNIESFLGVQPKTHCTDSAQLFGWSFPQWVSYPFRSEKSMIRHTAQHQVETIKLTKISYHLDQRVDFYAILNLNNKSNKNILQPSPWAPSTVDHHLDPDGHGESAIFPLLSLFRMLSFSREKLRFQVHLQ